METIDREANPEQMSNEDIVLTLMNANDAMARNAVMEYVMQRYKPILLNVLKRNGITASNRDDLMQEIFLRVFQNIATLREVEKLPGWIRSVAQGVVITFLRRNKFRGYNHTSDTPNLYDDNRLEWIVDHRLNGSRQQLPSNECSEEVQAVLDQLTALHRRRLEQFYLRGMSIREIQEEDEVPVASNVRRQLFEARNKFRKLSLQTTKSKTKAA